MHFLFKTRYEQDIRSSSTAARSSGTPRWPWHCLPRPSCCRTTACRSSASSGIYAIVCFGLMLLVGFTGQVSLGHAAFLAMGAYTEAYLQSMGWPFALSLTLSALVAGITGIIVGLPALRVKGMYLAIATLAFGFIVEEGCPRRAHHRRQRRLMQLGSLGLRPAHRQRAAHFYYLVADHPCWCVLGVMNLLRSPTGRAFVAIRDSEVSAQSMGINLARYKTTAFALSAAMAGIAGALYAHKIRFLSPDQFTFLQSIELLMILVIGGVGSIYGAIFGAAFWIIVQQLIVMAKDWLPPAIGQQTGLQPTIFGLILIAFVLFEPMGLYGRWLKIRTFFQLFPFYRKGMFKRQKSYMKSERMK
jgi:branched-chain amino acid transport system permease protein